MFRNTVQEVVNPNITNKEKSHSSRNRKAYHVFLSQYFSDFQNLGSQAKNELIIEREGYPEDDFSVNDQDSTDTPLYQRFGTGPIIRLAARAWKGLSDIVRSGWTQRADYLNSLPIPGRFTSVPEVLSQDLENRVQDSLTIEWTSLCVRRMRRLLRNQPRRLDFSRKRKFGEETFEIQMQSYGEIHISYLMKLVLFGEKNSIFTDYELVYITKKIYIAHIASVTRLKDIFTKYDLCAVEQEKDDMKFNFASKIFFSTRVGNSYGYIIDEDDDNFYVLLDDNEKLTVPRPFFCDESNKYIFEPLSNGYYVIEYRPIRLFLKFDGHMKFTMNRMVTRVDSDNLILNMCT